MNKSPNLGLSLTPASDGAKTFIVFRTELSGDDSDSNMMIIDTEIGKLKISVQSILEQMLDNARCEINENKITFQTYNSELETWEDISDAYVENALRASGASDSEKLGGQLPSYYAKASDIPAVPGVATTTSNGLMSSNDKTKLDSIGASGTFTLPSASWSVGSSVVTQTAAVSGITATQAYIFDIVPTNANEVKAYGYIGKIESVSGGFRATCYDTTKYPTVNLTIQYRRVA